MDDAWIQEVKLTASDAAAGDDFGLTVAARGSTILVGARSTDDDGDQSGSAYVFTLSGDTWSERGILRDVAGGAAGDQLGDAVAMDSAWMVVGAPHWGASDQGAALIYCTPP